MIVLGRAFSADLACPPATESTREEMRDAKLPMAYRDGCANLLIPLNRCRFETYYLPWKCEVRRTNPHIGGHDAANKRN